MKYLLICFSLLSLLTACGGPSDPAPKELWEEKFKLWCNEASWTNEDRVRFSKLTLEILPQYYKTGKELNSPWKSKEMMEIYNKNNIKYHVENCKSNSSAAPSESAAKDAAATGGADLGLGVKLANEVCACYTESKADASLAVQCLQKQIELQERLKSDPIQTSAYLTKLSSCESLAGKGASASPSPAPTSAPAPAAAPTPAPAATAAPAPTPVPPAAPAPVAEVVKPSFDCSKASNNAEKMICSSQELARLDQQLSSSYKKAGEGSSDKDALKKTQIEWVKSSRKCPDEACLVKAYKSRIAELSK